MNNLIAIVGPTATGKSQLGIHLAQSFAGEIINADSRQLYRYMDIGTAKPSRQELSVVLHHLIDIVNTDQAFSLAQYQVRAYDTIETVQKRGKLPLFVGGTGLYIWAVLEGWQVPKIPPDYEFRHLMAEKAAESGIAELQKELMQVDPMAAQQIDPRNIRRIIRALEVYKTTGIQFSTLQIKKPPPYRTLIIGLTVAREELYRRIDLRVEQMIQNGLVDELKRLLEMGYSLDLPAMSGIGYRQIGWYLKEQLTLEEAKRQIKFETHRFARHQYNWFRLKDERIKWFDITMPYQAQIASLVEAFLKKEPHS